MGSRRFTRRFWSALAFWAAMAVVAVVAFWLSSRGARSVPLDHSRLWLLAAMAVAWTVFVGWVFLRANGPSAPAR
jgi:lipopolysaccharide export LptBFGC system permease protein LptF